MTYTDATRRITTKWGLEKGPDIALCENGSATVALTTTGPCTVWELATTGKRVRQVPCEVKDGTLRFEATTRNPDGRARLCYEIVKTAPQP